MVTDTGGRMVRWRGMLHAIFRLLIEHVSLTELFARCFGFVDRILVAVLPGSQEWLEQRRVKRGECRHCGYSLTGNVSGVCPECGTPTKQD